MHQKHSRIPINLERQVEATPFQIVPEPSTSHSTTSKIINKPLGAQQMITDFVTRRRPISMQRSQAIDKQVVKWISKGHHSLRMVDEPELKKLLEMVAQTPGYTLPSRKTLSQSFIPKFYTETVESVQNQLNSAKAVSVTTNGWTSDYTKDSYIAVTAHYINEEMELCSYTLECIQYEDKHTSEKLPEFLKDCFRQALEY
ncbi:unnamed protein product [Arctia plantaginis]|uniref:Uncharacterized protein n=1 Tax=Arctia plantaginis TaxID=874455 RepID=A0A8S1B359_ARCPL|nr:unnamed protein product [Arctia plantaginis]